MRRLALFSVGKSSNIDQYWKYIFQGQQFFGGSPSDETWGFPLESTDFMERFAGVPGIGYLGDCRIWNGSVIRGIGIAGKRISQRMAVRKKCCVQMVRVDCTDILPPALLAGA